MRNNRIYKARSQNPALFAFLKTKKAAFEVGAFPIDFQKLATATIVFFCGSTRYILKQR
jgi:hypothetical protein